MLWLSYCWAHILKNSCSPCLSGISLRKVFGTSANGLRPSALSAYSSGDKCGISSFLPELFFFPSEDILIPLRFLLVELSSKIFFLKFDVLCHPGKFYFFLPSSLDVFASQRLPLLLLSTVPSWVFFPPPLARLTMNYSFLNLYF